MTNLDKKILRLGLRARNEIRDRKVAERAVQDPKHEGGILVAGEKIYYTGDMANADGFGEIVLVDSSGRFGTQVKIKMDDGRSFWISPASFVPGPGRRFMLKSEADAERAERIASFNQSYLESLVRSAKKSEEV
ncbi:MAG: hypothetical protein IMZ57_11030 [Acidobacteria bacterium]|nr:hypothetical protein [Acidobacteriota bacterium]